MLDQVLNTFLGHLTKYCAELTLNMGLNEIIATRKETAKLLLFIHSYDYGLYTIPTITKAKSFLNETKFSRMF